jgi:hypothetical protein
LSSGREKKREQKKMQKGKLEVISVNNQNPDKEKKSKANKFKQLLIK